MEPKEVKTVEDLNAYVAELIGKEAGEIREELQALHSGLDERKTSHEEMVQQLGDLRKTGFAKPGDLAPGERAAQKGTFAAQYIQALGGLALERRQGNLISTKEYVAKRFGAESLVAKTISAADFESGGALVPEVVSAEIIELLYGKTVFMEGNPMIVPMPTGSATIPKITAGTAASWVGENAGPNADEPTFGHVRLSARKLRVTTPMSNDWLRRTSPAAEAAVIRDILRAGSLAINTAFLRADGSEFQPTGLLNQVAAGNKFDANGTVNLANVTVDLGKCWLALEGNDVDIDSGYWMWAPRTENYLRSLRDTNGNFAFRPELLAGQMMGSPTAYTTAIPINLGGGTESEIYFANMGDIAVGEALAAEVTVSTEASYKDSGGNLVSAFDNDESVIRLILELDMKLRYDVAATVMEAVIWI